MYLLERGRLVYDDTTMTANSASPGPGPGAGGGDVALCCVDAASRIVATNARWRAAMRRASGTWAQNAEGHALCASPAVLAVLRQVLAGDRCHSELPAATAQWPLPDTGPFVVVGGPAGATISFATHGSLAIPGERPDQEPAPAALPDAYTLLGRAILAAAPDAAFVLAADGPTCWRVLDVNAAAAALHGVPREDLLGTSFLAATPPGELADARTQLELLQRTGAVRFASQRQRQGGGALPCEVSATILRLAGHSYAFVFVRDCTEQQRREAELANQAMRLEIAVRSSGVGFWDWVLADDATFYSREWKAQLGYAPEEVADRFDAWQRLCHPDDVAPTLELVRHHLAGQTTLFEAEFRMRHKDGDYRWILSQGRVIRDADGNAVRLVGCHVDVTARRRAEQERLAMLARIEQTQRLEAMGTLAGGLAHDFNNILTVISGNVDLAELCIGDAATQREALADVRRGTARARSLVRQIQVFSRNDPPERSAVAVHELLAETLRLLRASLPKAIALASSVASDLPEIDVDPQQIQQLLLNLGANAWQAIGNRPGRVELLAERVELRGATAADLDLPAGVYVRIVVRDDGCGMAAATRERIFEPFFTTRLEQGGTGLGLSVVHGIARRHGGAVSVASEPGQGSTFTVHLPAHVAAVPAVAAAAVAVPQGPLGRLLLVEDDAALLRVLKRGLELLGHRVAAFDEPVAAFAAVRSEPAAFSAVVADHDLPGMRGSEFAQAVRELCPTLPIVLTSGLVTPELASTVQQLGGARLLQKPFVPRDLANLLTSLSVDRRPGG